MITVYVRKIEEINIDTERAILSSMSDSARHRLDKKRNLPLRLASLCALSLLNDEQRTDLDYSDSGRPFFKTLQGDISISHSGAFCAVAISDSANEPVGVDIEDMVRDTSSLPRFFTPTERDSLTDTRQVIEIWTKKEATFKFLKNDSVPFPALDSTNPESFGAKYLSAELDNCMLTVCAPIASEVRIIKK